jgi:hypothetical protein
VWTGAIRPGRQHDQTALKTEGIADLLDQFPTVPVKVDAGSTPQTRKERLTRGRDPLWETERKTQSSPRICVEPANAEHKQWRTLQRYIGRREYYDQTDLAIAGRRAAPPNADQPDHPPDQHTPTPTPIVHNVVSRLREWQ